MESQVDADIPISSASVVMLSPPGTQDVFHTPPEESLLPSSDIDVPLCTLNQAVDLDAGSQAFVELVALSNSSEFVDFGKDSELGFSQVAQLKNEIDAADSATENCSRGFRVLEKGVSDLGENPVKKLKLGFHSTGNCSGVQSQKVEGGFGNCDEGKVKNACKFGEDVVHQSNGVGGEHVNDDFCREIQMDGNSVPPKEDVEMENSVPNFETEVVQNVGDVNLIMRKKNNSDNEIGEGSEMREDLEEVTANGSGPEKVERGKKFSIFDVLRVLAENSKNDENETKGCTLLETAKRCGITFPRPSSWPANRKSEIFKFDDEVESLVPGENVETVVVENAADVNLIMGKNNNSDNEIGEGSGTREDLEEATANGSGPEKVERAKKFSVFDVLRVLAENSKNDENKTKGCTLLDTAKRCGITFPRPSHWPANRKSELFKFDDEVEK